MENTAPPGSLLKSTSAPFFYGDDHRDGPQCWGHVMLVIQLVPESAPKPSRYRLAKWETI